jgi:fermentation-respiration switch protein FrsA (DUF1100 family)
VIGENMNVQIQFTTLKTVRKDKKSKKAKIIIYSILFIFIAVNLAGLYAGNVFYKKAFEIDTKKDIDQYESNKNTFSEKRFTSLQREEVSVASKNNYRLYGTYIKNAQNTKDTMILVHGLSGSRYTVLKYVDMYLDKGFNVLIYDAKNHGHSGGDNTTYGYDEKFDLDSMVKWVYSRNKGGIIGVHGESMGAATALLHSKLNEEKKRVNFYIADCSYSDLNELFTKRLKDDFNIKVSLAAKPLIFYAEIVNKIKNQFDFDEASPKSVLKDVTTPIMFIHGANDDYVPTYMSEDMYNIKGGSKELYIAPNSGHVQAYTNNIDVYIEKIYSFIDKYSIDEKPSAENK